MPKIGHLKVIGSWRKLSGLNPLAVEAEETLAQADPESPAGFGQVVGAEHRRLAKPDQTRAAAFGLSRLKEIERPTRCTSRSLRSGPRPLETDAA